MQESNGRRRRTMIYFDFENRKTDMNRNYLSSRYIRFLIERSEEIQPGQSMPSQASRPVGLLDKASNFVDLLRKVSNIVFTLGPIVMLLQSQIVL